MNILRSFVIALVCLFCLGFSCDTSEPLNGEQQQQQQRKKIRKVKKGFPKISWGPHAEGVAIVDNNETVKVKIVGSAGRKYNYFIRSSMTNGLHISKADSDAISVRGNFSMRSKNLSLDHSFTGEAKIHFDLPTGTPEAFVNICAIYADLPRKDENVVCQEKMIKALEGNIKVDAQLEHQGKMDFGSRAEVSIFIKKGSGPYKLRIFSKNNKSFGWPENHDDLDSLLSWKVIEPDNLVTVEKISEGFNLAPLKVLSTYAVGAEVAFEFSNSDGPVFEEIITLK